MVPRSGVETRERLLDAAERLFAERGIDNVAISEITAAAGQKNNSAVQYHFGGRMDLLSEVIARRQAEIDPLRNHLIDRLETADVITVEQVVGAIVEPVAELLGSEGGRSYLRIQASLLSYPDPDALPEHLRESWNRPALDRLAPQVLRIMPNLEPETGEERSLLISTLLFHGLANWAGRQSEVTLGEQRRFTQTLIKAISAVLTIPLG